MLGLNRYGDILAIATWPGTTVLWHWIGFWIITSPAELHPDNRPKNHVNQPHSD